MHFDKTYSFREGVTLKRYPIYLVPKLSKTQRIELLKQEWQIIQEILDNFAGKIVEIIPKVNRN